MTSILCSGGAHVWCLTSREFHPDCDCMCHDHRFQQVADELTGSLGVKPKRPDLIKLP